MVKRGFVHRLKKWWRRFWLGTAADQRASNATGPDRWKNPAAGIRGDPQGLRGTILPDLPAVGRLVPSGGGAAWFLPRSALTPQQAAAVEAPPDRHRLVVGCSGSGKTLVLLHRADHLRRVQRLQPRDFRIFLFTNVLRDYLRSALALLDLPPGVVCTFDAWCHDFYLVNLKRPLPCQFPGGRPDFDAVRQAVLGFIAQRGAPDRPLECVLVDEGQDLPVEAYHILRRVARHVTVCADPGQRLYDSGASLEAIRDALGIGDDAVGLAGAYRNSPLVARLAAQFIEREADRREYLVHGGANRQTRERPLLFWAPSFEAEMDRLAEVVRHRAALNQRMGILTTGRRQVERVMEALLRRGVETEAALPPPPEYLASGATWVRFDNPTPKVASVFSAKGLTFDCVCLPDLTREAYGWMQEGLRRRLLFTGIVRAAEWVCLSAVESGALQEIKALETAAGDLLMVQRGFSAPVHAPARSDDYSFL